MPKAKTTAEFINAAKAIHGDKYDYSKTEYINSKTKVIIICPIHKKFNQLPSNHTSRKQGCAKCVGHHKTTESFIEELKAVHGNRFIYDKVEYTKAGDYITVECKEHGLFSIIASTHRSGVGCAKCAGKNKTTAEFIEQAKLVHGSKYTYEQVTYVNCKTYVTITCQFHQGFSQTPSNHLAGFGCGKCAKNVKLTTEEFIVKARRVHGGRYDYSKTIYSTGTDLITIHCPEHGPFLQAAASHLQNHGCSKCGGSHPSSTNEFIEKAILIHGTKYNYSYVNYTRAKECVAIECVEHGIFYMSPNNHLRGENCSRCSKVGYSKVQIEYLTFLEGYYNIAIQHKGNSAKEHSIKTTRWKADGYHKDTNTVYEFHGDYYHGNPRRYAASVMNVKLGFTMGTLYKRTIKREARIRELGYNLVVIWEMDWTRAIKLVKLIQRGWRKKLQQRMIDDLEEKIAAL